MKRQIESCTSATELYKAAAASIVGFLTDAIKVRGVAAIALSGGSTPGVVYELLSKEPLVSSLDWSKVHVFWGDERCVPPTHAESNFRMTNETLLQKIAIPETNIHRILAERPPQEAADAYAVEMKKFFGLADSRLPQFDVMLLGLGEDGHTASLFPETTVLNETRRLVAEVYVGKLKAYRISMTYPVINNSRVVMFLVSGSGKAEILHQVLEGKPDIYPAQRVEPAGGTVYWLVDRDASALLHGD